MNTKSKWTLSGLFLMLILSPCLQARSNSAESKLAPPSNYTMPSTGTASISACAGNMYDNGGNTGTYSNNADAVYTIYPGTPNKLVQLQLTMLEMEQDFDFLQIYDGVNTSAPLVQFLTGSITSPLTILASNTQGALTLRLSSDSYLTKQGFAATINCVNSTKPLTPDLTVSSAIVSSSPVISGKPANLNLTIGNIEAATAGASAVGYYLSTD